MSLFTNQKQIHRLKRMNLRLAGGRVGEGIDCELAVYMYTLQYLKSVTIKDLL